MTEPAEASREDEVATDEVPLRRNRNFRMLWIGQVLSDLGSQFGVLAYPLLILRLTDSPVIAGAVATIASLAAFLVRLPAGALSDRLNRRFSMVVVDSVRTVVLAGLAVGVALHAVDWEVVLVAALVDRLGDTIFGASSVATLPTIVPSAQLEDAWAATEARQFAAGLAGPTLGGILFTAGAALPFVGDAVSYGVSAITASQLRGDFQPPRTDTPRAGLWREAFEGIQVIWHNALLKAVIIQAPLINLMFNGVIATVTLALAYHGRSPVAIGIAQSTIMVGGLLGAIVAPRVKGRFTLSKLLVVLNAGGTVCFLAAAVVIPSPFVAIPIAIPFFVSPITNAALFAAMLRETPPELQGRVNNALIQLATGLAAFAPFLAGLLVAHLSPHGAMACFAIGLGVCSVLAVRLKGLRLAEQSTGATSQGRPPTQAT